jgi:hypothetical protein
MHKRRIRIACGDIPVVEVRDIGIVSEYDG